MANDGKVQNKSFVVTNSLFGQWLASQAYFEASTKRKPIFTDKTVAQGIAVHSVDFNVFVMQTPPDESATPHFSLTDDAGDTLSYTLAYPVTKGIARQYQQWSVSFWLFDMAGEAIVTKAARSITLHVSLPSGELQTTYSLTPPPATPTAQLS